MVSGGRRIYRPRMRICSLLPSATEIIAQLGLIDSLVGVSEECRWPPEVVGKPVVTAARIDPSTLTSLEIDQAVRESVGDGESLYTVDADLIDALAPDLIVTQDLCAVCAVSSNQLATACPVAADVLSLDPRTLGGRRGVGRRARNDSRRRRPRRSDRRRRCGRRSRRPPTRCAACHAGASSSPSGSSRRSAPGTGCRR